MQDLLWLREACFQKKTSILFPRFFQQMGILATAIQDGCGGLRTDHLVLGYRPQDKKKKMVI